MSLYADSGLKVSLEITNNCNAGCPQCHRTDPNGLTKVDWLKLTQWSLAKFKRAFPEGSLAAYHAIEFCGTFGDPIMNKDLFEICEYIIENDPNVKIHVNTNASIRSAQWWRKLGILGLGRINVIFDVDGINQEMHSKYRRKTDLSKVEENVRAYCSTGALACVTTIVFLHNEDYLSDIEKMIRSWGVIGEYKVIESSRFASGYIFNFIDENGNPDELIQTTKEPEEFFKQTVRDHRNGF